MKEVFKKCGEFIFEKQNKDKPWFKRRVVWLGVAILFAIAIIIAIPNNGKKEIPNVFGVYYEDAIEVLEAEGFEVNAIETQVKNISEKLLYPLGEVEEGNVFKIDDYILDGNGNMTFNYDVFYDGGLETNDKNIVIYYAKESYIADEKEKTEPTEKTEQEETVLPIVTEDPKNQEEKSSTSSGGIGSEFKSAMDSYEKFFDEYVAIMKKYANNPSDTSILKDYTKYMGKYAQMMSDFEKWESKEMNTAETAYYIEVQGRITKKLLEVAQ